MTLSTGAESEDASRGVGENSVERFTVWVNISNRKHEHKKAIKI
jgi:hypothetical protein